MEPAFLCGKMNLGSENKTKLRSTHQPWRWWSSATGRRSTWPYRPGADRSEWSLPGSAGGVERVNTPNWTAGFQTTQSEEGVDLDLPSSRTAAERRAFRTHRGARRLQPGAPGCSWDSPSVRRRKEALYQTSNRDRGSRLMRTCLYLFGFPFQCALIHESLRSRPLNLEERVEWKLAKVEKNVLFLLLFFFFFALPCCFWQSRWSCWAQRRPPWRPRTERHSAHSAAEWSS